MFSGLKRVILAITGVALVAMSAFAYPLSVTDVEPQADYGRLTPFILDPAVVLPSLSLGQKDDSLYRLSEIDNGFSLIEGIGLYTGLNIDVAGVFDDYSRNLYGLFPGALPTESYLSMTGARSDASVRTMLADGLRFTFGQAFRRAGLAPNVANLAGRGGLYGLNVPGDRSGFDTVQGALSWDFAKWGRISLVAEQTAERGSPALGNAAPLGGRQIAALGVATHLGFGNGWVTTLSYNQANAQLSLKPVGANAGESILRGQSYGIAVAKRGLFGHDSLGLSLSRPTGAYNDVNSDMQFQFYGRDTLFPKKGQETDIELGYVTTFLDGPLALQANASYQVNYNGQNKDSLAFMSRAKIKF